jgi:hypothetical protein
VRCNTAKEEWSIFKPWWRRFQGVAIRYLYLYLTQYAFARTYRERSSIERLKMMLGFLYAFPGHVLRIQLGPYALTWAY